jgi:hypothetical protein
MKFKLLLLALALSGFALGIFVVSAQEPGDNDVRGAFISTRPKTTNANAPARRRRTHNSNGSTSSGATKNENSSNDNASSSRNRNSNSARARTQAIGIGYTLYMRDANGRGVRVEPTREFHNGDSVRLSLEPNVDGYLYIFDVENDSTPQMIYPDARLDGGDNFVEAHVPVETPSSEESDERLRWFTFYGNSGTDHLFMVVTREPLKSVPTGDELVSLCATAKDKCPWHPSAEVWTQIQDATKAEVKVVTTNAFGQPQTEKEKTATTRGIGLDQSVPPPSVIRMNASTNAALLVAVLDLIHK